MATNETPEQREARLVRLAHHREQYRQRRAAETADAREARLEHQRESAQCTSQLHTPATSSSSNTAQEDLAYDSGEKSSEK